MTFLPLHFAGISQSRLDPYKTIVITKHSVRDIALSAETHRVGGHPTLGREDRVLNGLGAWRELIPTLGEWPR